MSMEDNMGRMRDNEFGCRRIKKTRRRTHGKIKGRIYRSMSSVWKNNLDLQEYPYGDGG